MPRPYAIPVGVFTHDSGLAQPVGEPLFQLYTKSPAGASLPGANEPLRDEGSAVHFHTTVRMDFGLAPSVLSAALPIQFRGIPRKEGTMMPKHRSLPLIAGLLVLLVIVTSTAMAQDPGPQPITPLRPIFELAYPRAGIVSLFSGGAENFLHPPGATEEPLLRVPAGQPFRLTAPYEAVMFGLTAGWAEFSIQAHLITPEGEQLLDRDKAQVINFGPRIYRGALNLDLQFDEPGTYQVRFRGVTRVKPVGTPDVTTDEDEVMATIEVYAPEEGANARRPLAVGRLSPQLAPTQTLIQPTPTQAPVEPTPIPILPGQTVATRTVQVALPRGHMVDARNAAVDNFERVHNTAIVLRPGQTLRLLAGPYEFVWYEGATGSAKASLTVLSARATGVPSISLGRDEVEYPEVEGPARRRGSLQVDVAFDEPGIYYLMARVRSAMRSSPATDVRGWVDEDNVRLKVVVIGVPETGAIAGVVTAEDTLPPLADVIVRAYHAASGRKVAETRSDENGVYVLDELKPGRYLVQAIPDRQNYLGEWYDDQPRREQADPVAVEAGRTTEGIDFALTPGASITGIVVEDPDSTDTLPPKPLGGILIQVGVFDSSRLQNIIVGETRTLDDGSYAVYQLPAGTYWVRAVDPEGLYRTEYWDDAPALAEADPVTLATGELVEGIDFALELAGGGIAGRVIREGIATDPAVIEPLPGIIITAVDAETGERMGKAETGPNGRYRIGGLPAGDYLVHAEDPRGRFRDEWYDDKPSQEQADPVPVENGQITRRIDFALAPVVQEPTLLRVDPPTTSVGQPGDAFDISLVIEDVEDLGSFEVTLAYDPAIVHVEGVELGTFLREPAGTDRRYELLEPIIDNESGQARFGVFSLGHAPGVSGSGQVLAIRMVAQGGGDTLLHLQDVQVLNTIPEIIPTRTEDGRVRVGGCLAYDFDCDCDVDIADVSKVARRWGTEEGDPEYDPLYDLDSDGDIDIMDVAIVAAAWGMVCEDREGQRSGAEATPTLSEKRLQGIGLLATVVSVEAPDAPVRVGEEVSVPIRIREGVDVKSFEFTLAYDPGVLQAEGADLGDFLADAFALEPIIDPLTGTIRFGAADLGLDAGATGDGVLAVVRFRVIGVGTSPLALTGVQLVDSLDRVQTDVSWSSAELVAEGEAAYLPLVRQG